MIRVLHIVGGMNHGGIESWIMHLLRSVDRGQFSMDVLQFNPLANYYTEEIRNLGLNPIICRRSRNLLRFNSAFRATLGTYGPYDIVHSHVQLFSGYVLRIAAAQGIPIRVAHAHNSRDEKPDSACRYLYRRLMLHWIDKYSTARLGCSGVAAQALFPAGPSRENHSRVLHCGIDLSAFSEESELREQPRAELGLPRHAVVVGHAARFVPAKNHLFWIKIAKELSAMDPSIWFLLVGEGPLRGQIESEVRRSGIESRVIFAGARSDVPRLMLSTMDAFLLPSLYEGLPLTVLEAQAAGLPCVLADCITRELAILPSTEFVSLSSPPRFWARRVLENLRRGRTPSRVATHALKQAGFCHHDSVRNLCNIYQDLVLARHPHKPQICSA